MKKNILIFFIFVFCSGLYSQSAVEKANRRTAERCLKLAENCLVAGDWENAVKQVRMGLSYDDSISDFYYIKAASEANLGESKSVVLNTVFQAFEKNNWISYSKAGARILYADLLSDTGKYEASLKVLDEEPFIYSADAEFIRIKNYYRIGTPKYLEMARLKVNTTRRIYPDDSRFLDLFFVNESSLINHALMEGDEYEIPEIVRTITDSYILHLPKYDNGDVQTAILASFLADDEVRVRLVNSVISMNTELTPIAIIAGLKAGVFGDAEAFNLFIGASREYVSYWLLKLFISCVQDEDVKNQIAEYLKQFEGTLLVDENSDFQDEITVKYECGRPLYFSYDGDNDGVEDFHVVCDLGSPLSVVYNNLSVELFFDFYPFVKHINYITQKLSYDFLKGDYLFEPFDFVCENSIAALGAEFYVPFINREIILPDSESIITKASSIAMATKERNNSKVVYYSHDGKLSYADFYENSTRYAWCNFEEGMPVIRYLDADGDSVFETIQTFDSPENMSLDTNYNAEDMELCENIFSNVFNSNPMVLKKIQIDRNGNNNIEFSEEYLGGNGKIDLWDYDDNGIWDNQYIRYPSESDESIIEENVFFDDMGLFSVSLISKDSVPVRIKLSDQNEIPVILGSKENCYWIGTADDIDDESEIIKNLRNDFKQGSVDIVQIKTKRYMVVKVGANYYLRLIDILAENAEIEEKADAE